MDEPIYILGISAFYHDSAACLLKDGAIVAAAQEERFSRKKHDEAFPRQAVDYCLREAGIAMSQVKYVAFYEKPFIKFERLLAALNKARKVEAAQVEAVAEATSARRKHLAIHERGKIVLVPIADIIYLKAELKYVTVKTAAKEHLLEESLTKLEDEFAGLFTRIHRSALVANKAVAGFEKVSDGPENGEEGGSHWVVVLSGVEEKLPVSRRQAHVIREF